MKRLFIACTATILIFSLQATFAQQVAQVKTTSALNMRGTYIMLKQILDSGMGPGTTNIQQWKIYTDKYVMYVHRRSETDSMAEFGVGSYRIENGKVIENMFHGASGPVNNTFELAISKHGDGYTQVINFPANGKNYLLTEDYKQSEKKVSSPLDGAWKMTKVVNVARDGKANTYENFTDAAQFKFYEGGSFMWANQWKDSESGKIRSAYGYGTFETNAPDQITETNVSSTYASALVGKPLVLKITFIGNDIYEQTITGADGSKSTERYERMK